MSAWLIALTGVIYTYVALEQGIRFNNLPMAITYIGYALGNVGLYMIASK